MQISQWDFEWDACLFTPGGWGGGFSFVLDAWFLVVRVDQKEEANEVREPSAKKHDVSYDFRS